MYDIKIIHIRSILYNSMEIKCKKIVFYIRNKKYTFVSHDERLRLQFLTQTSTLFDFLISQ